MSTPGQAAAWLEAERANLQAAADYAAASGRHRHAMLIPVAMGRLPAYRGLLGPGPRRAPDRLAPGQAPCSWRCLSEAHFSTNDRAAAIASTQQALELYRDLGDRAGQAKALNGLGFVHRLTGDYRPPLPATSGRWSCTATSATSAARPNPSAAWAPCSRRPGTTGPLPRATGGR